MKSLINPQFFTYAIPVTAVGAGLTVTPQINIGNDADFVILEIRSSQQAAGAILMQMSVADQVLFSNAFLDTLLFSGPNYPVRFVDPIRIPANSQINVTLQNTTGGGLNHQIQLWGYKVDKQV